VQPSAQCAAARATIQGHKVNAERLTVVRPRTFNDGGTLDDDDTRMVRGSISFEQTQPGFGTWTDAYRFSSLDDPTRLESGDLVVNGSVVARFYSAANWFEALQPTGQCQ
jgi:hypothetical protein